MSTTSLLGAVVAAAAQIAPGGELAQTQLRTLNHRFVNAVAAGDVAFLATLADDDFRMIGQAGARIDRAGYLAAMARPSGLAGVAYDDLRVRLFGPVALVHGVFEALDAQHQPLRVRYTDTFRWNGTQWKLVAAQNTPLRAGVAKAQQRGTVPAHAAWTGSGPTGDDDIAVLRQLNEDYVRAFREADVGWYDAHLADDYVVTNGDGSFADRAAALQAFAKPTFATMLRTFPVDQVHIRRFGDIALIEAENDYETQDGRRGVSRYTDIWHKVDGRWRCVSAHITVFKAPV